MSLNDEVTKTIKPGNDFYSYANARWLESHPIPADKARMGVFEDLSDENIKKLRTLLEAPVKNSDAKTIQLARKYYQSGMNEARLNETSPEIVAALVSEARDLHDLPGLIAYLTSKHAEGKSFVWHTGIDLDDKDSRRYLMRIFQSGLGLPDRDYYLVKSERFSSILEKYQAFLVSLFNLAGLETADERAASVIDLETKLAEASMTATERRDPIKTYNIFDTAGMAANFPDLDWGSYLVGIGFPATAEINIAQTAFITAATKLLGSEDITAWQNYAIVHSLRSYMSMLSDTYADLAFDFYGRVLQGTETREPRYQRVIRSTIASLPEPTGRLFIENYFDESAKKEIADLVSHLQTAFGERLKNLSWMSEATKIKALGKLATFLPLLGYPESWRPYDDLELGETYLLNAVAINKFEWARDIARLERPVDRREWLMSPVEVNAYYWPNTNGITFPAGILQPPFFDANGDFAANYGGIGSVIGHEMTHGFDDQGSLFDADGNLVTWWDEADRSAFNDRTKLLVSQYSHYDVAGQKVNGELTLGENIADLGGLHIAYDALEAKLKELGAAESIDGYSPQQRFFVGYARVWRENIRPEMSLQFLVTDPHSPDKYRTNGIVRNTDAFYSAFEIDPSDDLYLAPDERVRIW